MNFEKIVREVIEEQNVAGGARSSFGPGVQATASQFSGDTYAPEDARNVFGGVLPKIQTRFGAISRKKNKTKKRRLKRK